MDIKEIIYNCLGGVILNIEVKPNIITFNFDGELTYDNLCRLSKELKTTKISFEPIVVGNCPTCSYDTEIVVTVENYELFN